MPNKISIVLPCYNGENFLLQAIESILSQTYINWELILVNDCSTDNTANICEEYAKKDKRIIVIHNQQNQKLPKSLNIGFAKASGEYLTWTSDDNYYKPTAFEEMVQCLDKQSNAIMVCCDYKVINENNAFVKNETVDPRPEKMLVNNFCGACFLYRKKAIELIGNYDETRFLVEDYNYWLRMGLAGEIHALHKNLYVYRMHSTSLTSTRNQEITRLAQEESFLFLDKYLKKYPHIEKTQEYNNVILTQKVFNLALNPTKEKIQELQKVTDTNTLYSLFKKAYRQTGNRFFIRAMRKLGIIYTLKAFFFEKRNKKFQKLNDNSDKSYSERLSASEWGKLYNIEQKNDLIKAIQDKNYTVQTKEILKLADNGMTTLEIASGTGQSTLCLAQKGCIASALDFEQKCLDLTSSVAKELNLNVKTYCLDALGKLPFKEKEFDIIFHSGLMEHFTQEERISMFKHWRPYCKKMVSMVPNASSLAYRVGKAIMEKNGTWEYGLEMPITTQKEDFIKAGYEIVDEYTIGAEHALNFLDKKHPLYKPLQEWLANNPCDDICNQGYLLVTIAINITN